MPLELVEPIASARTVARDEGGARVELVVVLDPHHPAHPATQIPIDIERIGMLVIDHRQADEPLMHRWTHGDLPLSLPGGDLIAVAQTMADDPGEGVVCLGPVTIDAHTAMAAHRADATNWVKTLSGNSSGCR